MKLTRRQVAASLAAVAAVPAPAVAQTPPSQPQPDDLTAARDRLKNNAGALASVPFPMSTEPAFQFKA
jgi:hypothetical protein